MQDTDPLRIALLGPLEVRREGHGSLEVPGRRLRALLIRLALEPGRVVSAERLIDDLWREDPPAAASNALQALVSRLRGVLGRATIESGGGYRLNAPAEAVDVVRFEQGVRAARGRLDARDPVGAAELLRAAIGLWRGDALVDVEGEPFAEIARAALESRRVTAIEDLVEAVLASRAAHEANALIPELERLRTAYPLREALHGGYMRLLYATGRHAEALAAYEQLRSTLAETLGVDPSPETARLYLAILRQDPELPPSPVGAPAPVPVAAPAFGADVPGIGVGAGSGARVATALAATASAASAVATARGRAHAHTHAHAHAHGNLPAQLTSFIGRESELEQVKVLLAQSRLVTLVGPGGAGKTRLAQESGSSVAGEVSDGVWFVPLASVANGGDVPQAVVTALGGDESVLLTALAMERVETGSALERLCAMLASRDPLLILDNCEHVIDDVAVLVDTVLAAAPGVRVLATSREPLALTGETLCPVASLALPPDEPSAGESVLEYSSVRLLVERARAVRPGFAVNEANVAAVTRICRSLDGIPLAIELAAARLRSLTPQQVAERLDDRFRLLSSGSRTALPRHQTLRAIVDWSWDLLSPAERAVLARLSAFAGGATPEAAAPVCAARGAAEETAADRPTAGAVGIDDVVDVIASLVDKSLVVAQEDEAGEVRYRLLETVRAYAAERLAESGDLTAVRDAHAQHYLALAEHADGYLRGSEQMTWIVRLTIERDNFNTALRHAVAAGDVESALRFFQALTWFWLMRNHENDAVQWSAEIDGLIESTAFEVPERLREAHMLCLGQQRVVASFREHPGEAGAIGEALAGFLPPDSLRARHPVLAIARPIASILGGHGTELGEIQAELDVLAEHPDPWVRAVRHAFAGLLLLHHARPVEAEESLHIAYAAHKEIGDRLGLMFSLVMLTEFSLARGRFDEAVRRSQEAYGYASEGISGDNGSLMLVRLGLARALAGEPEAGRRLMELAATSAERLGEYGEAAGGYSEMAALALRAGDRAEARRRLAQAMELIETRVDEHGFVGMAYSTTVVRKAYLAALDGEFEAARELLRKAVEAVRSGPLLSFMSGLDEVVRGLAAVAGLEGDHVRAAQLLGSAHAVVGMDNEASYSDGPTRAAALAALGETAFQAAYERGLRLHRSEVLALTP